MKEACDLLRGLTAPMVAVIGPVCRTWYVDIEWLFQALETLRDTNPTTRLCSESAVGLGLHIRRLAEHLEMELEIPVPGSVEMVLALPPEDAGTATNYKQRVPKRHSVLEAGPLVVSAIDVGIPVLGLWRDGRTEFLGGTNAL